MVSITFPEWDTKLLLYLNSKHIWWLDPVMYALSSYTLWIIVCIALATYIMYNNKTTGIRVTFFMLLGIGINSLLSNIIKIFIMRPRPGNDIYIQDIVRQLESAGNDYSFFSVHSSNSICLALFTTLFFRNKFYGLIAFAWAILVAYSRIYVGKHYPLDILCGIAFGLITGWFTYWLYQRYYLNKSKIS